MQRGPCFPFPRKTQEVYAGSATVGRLRLRTTAIEREIHGPELAGARPSAVTGRNQSGAITPQFVRRSLARRRPCIRDCATVRTGTS